MNASLLLYRPLLRLPLSSFVSADPTDVLIEDVQLHFKPRTTAIPPETEQEKEANRKKEEEEKASWTAGMVTNAKSHILANLRMVVRRVVVRYAHTEEARQGSAMDSQKIDQKEEFAVGFTLDSFTIQVVTILYAYRLQPSCSLPCSPFSALYYTVLYESRRGDRWRHQHPNQEIGGLGGVVLWDSLRGAVFAYGGLQR